MKRYMVNEMFYSLQGEGVRAGTANLFVRFSKCNLHCNRAEHGFDCDTSFDTGVWATADELVAEMRKMADPECDWAILTGGEPMLQLDSALVQAMRDDGWHLAIETNGTIPIPFALDWICVSPKGVTRQLRADEVKYVLAAGQEPPDLPIKADHYLVSPAFDGDVLSPGALEWCIQWCLHNPAYRLSVQQHKGWRIR